MSRALACGILCIARPPDPSPPVAAAATPPSASTPAPAASPPPSRCEARRHRELPFAAEVTTAGEILIKQDEAKPAKQFGPHGTIATPCHRSSPSPHSRTISLLSP